MEAIVKGARLLDAKNIRFDLFAVLGIAPNRAEKRLMERQYRKISAILHEDKRRIHPEAYELIQRKGFPSQIVLNQTKSFLDDIDDQELMYVAAFWQQWSGSFWHPTALINGEKDMEVVGAPDPNYWGNTGQPSETSGQWRPPTREEIDASVVALDCSGNDYLYPKMATYSKNFNPKVNLERRGHAQSPQLISSDSDEEPDQKPHPTSRKRPRPSTHDTRTSADEYSDSGQPSSESSDSTDSSSRKSAGGSAYDPDEFVIPDDPPPPKRSKKDPTAPQATPRRTNRRVYNTRSKAKANCSTPSRRHVSDTGAGIRGTSNHSTPRATRPSAPRSRNNPSPQRRTHGRVPTTQKAQQPFS